VGVLAKGFHTIASPPVINSVTPQTVIASQPSTLVIAGSGIRDRLPCRTAWLSGVLGAARHRDNRPPRSRCPADLSGATPDAADCHDQRGHDGSRRGVRAAHRQTARPPMHRTRARRAATCLPPHGVLRGRLRERLGATSARGSSPRPRRTDVRQLPRSAQRGLGRRGGDTSTRRRGSSTRSAADDGTVARRERATSPRPSSARSETCWGGPTQRHAMLKGAHRSGDDPARPVLSTRSAAFDGAAALRSVEARRVSSIRSMRRRCPGFDLTPKHDRPSPRGSWVCTASAACAAASYASDPKRRDACRPIRLNVTLPRFLTSMTTTARGSR